MQDDSVRRTPPILFARPTYEWLSRVNQKRQQLSGIELSAEQRASLDRWIETEFVYSTLKLEGAGVDRDQVARCVSLPLSGSAPSQSANAIQALLESLREVTDLARDRGKAAALTVDLLLRLHKVPNTAAGFRTGAGDATRLAKPAPALNLRTVIESACQWYTAESFGELHPVEQASIVLLRLLEIQPFEQANERTALLAASLFTLRSGLPPLILKLEMDSAYRNALEEGRRMNTKPMVEFVAGAVERSLIEMIARSERNDERKHAKRKD